MCLTHDSLALESAGTTKVQAFRIGAWSVSLEQAQCRADNKKKRKGKKEEAKSPNDGIRIPGSPGIEPKG